MKPAAPYLTKRLLEAMEEALLFRLAGELDAEANPSRDYDDALEWIAGELAKRNRAEIALSALGVDG